jgi:hypothetical protein
LISPEKWPQVARHSLLGGTSSLLGLGASPSKPGGLAEQWQDELYRRFHLPFEILTNDKLEAARTGNWFLETISHNPWTMGVIASYETEGIVYGKYILQNIKNAKVGVLYQNDDLGRDYLKGLQEGLGDQAQSAIIKATSYELTDPTTQIIVSSAACTTDNSSQIERIHGWAAPCAEQCPGKSLLDHGLHRSIRLKAKRTE